MNENDIWAREGSVDAVFDSLTVTFELDLFDESVDPIHKIYSHIKLDQTNFK